jgi:hypothetical protein
MNAKRAREIAVQTILAFFLVVLLVSLLAKRLFHPR